MERYFDLYLNAGVSTPLVINCNQYDKSETWIFTLYDETGLPYQPASGSIVGLKADGNTIMNAGTVNSSGQVVIQQTEQMTAVAGKSEFELILDASHGTANFILLVERRPGDNAVPSESDISLIEQAIEAASNITQVVELTNIVNSVRNEMTNFIADNAGLPNETVLSTDEIYRVWQSSATTPTGGKTVLSAKVTDYDVIAVYTTISTLGGSSTTPEAHYFNAQDFADKITTVVCGTSRESATSKDMFVPMLSLICDSDEKTITCSSAKLVAWNGTASSDATVTESGSTNVQGSIVRITGIRNDQLDTEVVNARVGADSTRYNTLKERLDAENSDLKSQISDIEEQIEGGTGGDGLTSAIKSALMQLANNVAFKDTNGQSYIDDLYDALYPAIVVTAIRLNKNSLSLGALNTTQQLIATTTPSGGAVVWSSSNPSVATVSSTGLVTAVGYGNATITATSGNVSATCSVAITQATLSSISAVYTQTGTVYDTDSLDSLKSDLVVTAIWSDSSTSTVASADYTLSGTLATGTSTITVSYGGKTTTFTVTVTTSPYIMDGIVHYWDAIDNTGSGHDSSATVWKDLVGNCDLTMNSGVTSTSWDANALVFNPASAGTKQAWQNTDGITDSTNMTVEVIITPASNVGNSMVASFKSYANDQNKRIGMSASDISCLVYSADADGGYLTGLSSLADVRQIVGTYTSQSGSSGCYINGVQKTSRAAHTYNYVLTGMVIGSYNSSAGSSYPFKGKIHAIRIYNRVLTAEEIQTNYQKAIAYYGLE